MRQDKLRKDLHPPDAQLLIAPGCTHCPIVLEGLSKLLKQGAIGRLDVVNIMAHPEIAREVGSRSVPWARIGPFELLGVRKQSELTRWAKLAARGEGWGEYYSQLLEAGQLAKVVSSIRANPETLQALVQLLFDTDNPIAVRIGIGAALEDLQSDGLLNSVTPILQELTRSPEAHTRADACHYLSLTGDSELIPTVRALLDDDNSEVREIAGETLEALASENPDSKT